MCAEFQCRFHWKSDRFSTRKTTVCKDVQGIFSLAKNNAFSGSSNFNAKEVFKVSQIFDRKGRAKVLFDCVECCKSVGGDDNIININEDCNEVGGRLSDEEARI